MKKGRTRIWEILTNGWRYELFFLLLIMGTICSFGLNSVRMGKQYTVPDAIYDTLKLFVLNGGRPPQGGEWYFLYPLLASYFIAPVITLGSILNWINNRLHNPQRGIDKLKGHIILGGMGKTGNVIFDMLEKQGKLVVPIDNDKECKYLQRLYSNGNKYVIGDIAVAQTLQRANISKAKLLICMSNNDVANVDAAVTAIKESNGKSNKEPNTEPNKLPDKDLKCLIQIKDIEFEQYITPILEKYGDQIKVINTYEIVAKKVLQDLKSTLDLSQNNYLFIIAGFGNFGKMVTHELLKANLVGKNKNKLIVIDQNAVVKLRTFLAERNEADNPDFFTAIADQIGDLQVWKNLDTGENILKKKIVILATDNDISNINTALQIKKIIGDEIFVVSRLFRNVNMIEDTLPKIKGYVFSKIFLDEIQQDIFGMLGRD